MALLLLQYNAMTSDDITLNFTTNFLNHNVSLAASEVVMYSTFMIESTMVDCLKFFQLIDPSLYRKIYPDINLLSSISDIKSELIYPFTFNSDPPPKF